MQKEIIELVGLPGSGKTTWAQSQSFPFFPNGKYTRTERFAALLLFKITHPIVFLRLCNLTLKQTPHVRRLKHKLFFLLGTALASERRAQKLNESRVIIDEGILQYLLGIFESPITKQDTQIMTHIINYLPRRTIRWFEADKEERTKRMQERERTPLAGFGEKYQTQWLSTVETNAPLFKNLLQKTKHTLREQGNF